ncbi:MAG: hypothetical protein C0436_03610 [Alphaproteobacteria bacterium]|nr:hypothetical protein [Alphaproteobacteria bacterium]
MMIQRFIRDEHGSVFIFVGLAIVVLLGVVGIAIDLGTQGMIKTRMQNAADAAALGGAVADGVTDAERERIARRYFALNYPDRYQGTDLTAANVGITTSGDTVLVDTNARSRKADIVQVVGVENITTRAVSEVRNTGSSSAEIRDVTMVMDASGSMNTTVDAVGGVDGTGPIRISEARTAANTLIDEMLCKNPTRGNRIGWVKFSRFCNSEVDCADLTQSLPLSASCSALTSQVSSYNGQGATNGAEGLERAEALMGAARPNVVRAVIYMTDGLNNVYGNYNYCWTTEQAASCIDGQGSPLADVPARDACSRMKAKGILIYGISFSQDARNAQVVRDCASGPEYYFYAPDGVALQQAFRDIITSIKKIRITR